MDPSRRRAPRGRRIFASLSLMGLVATGAALVAPQAASALPAVARFTTLPPERILDTRLAVGAPAGVVGAGAIIDLKVTGVGGVPDTGVTAVAFNLTATDTGGPGYVTAWPAGATQPTASNVNVVGAGASVANLVVVAVPVSGLVSLFTSTSANLLADIAGYWSAAPGGVSQEGRFVGLKPRRLLDTRTGIGGPAGLPGAGATVTFTVAGREGVPATGAAAAVLAVTATQSSAGGYVTAWPAGAARPNASILNLAGAGETVPNLVIVPLGSGQVSLYTLKATHLLADVVGYITDASAASSSDGLFVPMTPERFLDSRNLAPIGKLWPGQRNDLQITGRSTIPATGVSAVVANVTATAAVTAGYVTAFPAETAPPNASNLNPPGPGSTVSSLAFIALGPNGKVSLYSSGGTEALADVAGYFLGSPQAAEPGVPVDPPPPPAPPITRRPTVAGANAFPCVAGAPMDQIKRVDVNPGLLTYLQNLTPYSSGQNLLDLGYTIMANSGPLPARVALDPDFDQWMSSAGTVASVADLMLVLNRAYHETIHHLQAGRCALTGPSTGYPTPRIGFAQSAVYADVNTRIDAIELLSGQDASYAHTVADTYLKPGDPISAQGFESQMWEINAYVLSAEWGAGMNDTFGVGFLGDTAGNDDTMSAKFHQLARYLNLAQSQPTVWAALQSTGGLPRTVAEQWNLGVKSWQVYEQPSREPTLYWDLAFGPDVAPIAAFTGNAAGTTAPPRPPVAPSLVVASRPVAAASIVLAAERAG